MSLRLSAVVEQLPLRMPVVIAGYRMETIECLVVRLQRGRYVGRGEAAGIYYRNDSPLTMLREIEEKCGRIEAGVERRELASLLTSMSARNAIDCALWELESQERQKPVWELAGLPCVRPLQTTWTIVAGPPHEMAEAARAYVDARALKLKLLGDSADAQRVERVREARPDVWLAVDANQSLNRQSLRKLLPTLSAAKVGLIEQPLPVGLDAELASFSTDIPFAADESVQIVGDLEVARSYYQYVNIKLDKCGGLTEALHIAQVARALGLGLMVGNMVGTSLAMAPAYIVGQLCELVDLDGPLALTDDRSPGISYADGHITCSELVWGHAPSVG